MSFSSLRVNPRSGLSPTVLHQIWDMVDTAHRGVLDEDAFYRACRLVAHVQLGALEWCRERWSMGSVLIGPTVLTVLRRC